MFRVGDRVVNPTKGKGVVLGFSQIKEGELFVVWDNTHISPYWFKPEELELDKEYKVLQILRQWQRSR